MLVIDMGMITDDGRHMKSSLRRTIIIAFATNNTLVNKSIKNGNFPNRGICYFGWPQDKNERTHKE